MLAAIENTLSRNFSVAPWIAADSVTVVRLASVPKPMAIAAVSASAITTSSGMTCQASATTCEKIVSMPWPCGQAPEVTKILPDGSMRTSALSNGPTPVPST